MFKLIACYVYLLAFQVSIGYITHQPSSSLVIQEERIECPQECICLYVNSTSSIQSLQCSVQEDHERIPNSNGGSGSDLSTCVDLFNTSGSFQYLHTLSIVGCSSYTNLTSTSFISITSLTTLKLSHGALRYIELGSNSLIQDLQHLDLSHNQISYLPVEFLQSLNQLKELVLSGNSFIQFDLAYLPWSLNSLHLDHCPNLTSIDLSSPNQIQLKILSAQDNGKLIRFCPWILWSLKSLQRLDLRTCPQLELPHRMFKGKYDTLEDILIDQVTCDCSPPLDVFKHCRHGDKSLLVDTFRHQNCYRIPSDENATTEVTTKVFEPFSLDCVVNEEDESLDKFIWITPMGQIHVSNDDQACVTQANVVQDKCLNYMFRIYWANDQMQVLANGTLVIENFGWSDRGAYECVAYDQYARFKSILTYVHLEPDFRQNLYYLSLIYGFTTASGFLLVTLLFKLIHFLLLNYGCCLFCCCCKDQLPPKAKRLKSALESIEAYRGQQLKKLGENYAQQSDWIRQNCAVQMERVRENYNWQVQNLRDIRHYGSNQVTAVRDQYFEQMARIRDYSTTSLERLHENYYFQRQRLRKFNAQNYLKMRETRQYTRRTLQKVMENLPALYLDLTTCRQGMSERQGSMEWDPNVDPAQILELERYHQKRMQHFINAVGRDHSDHSLYFTPSGTPMRELQDDPSLSVKSASPNNNPEAYSAVYHQNHHQRTHQRVRSFSHFLPGSWFNTKEVKADIVAENHDNDYYDIMEKVKPEETEELLTSYMEENNVRLEMTNSTTEESSVQSSSEKKSSNSSSIKESKKTLMTNLSNTKSEIELNPIACSQQASSSGSRRKSL